MALLGSAARAEQCTFIGRAGGRVSPRSGQCTPGSAAVKEGREVCTQDGRAISETTWRNGERQGPGWYVDYNDQKLEVTWRGEVVDGPVKVHDKSGALLCTLSVVHGKTEGVVRELWPSGHLKQATLFKNGEESGPKLQLLDDGRVVALTCGETSFTPEDRKLCGHDGAVSTVQFFQINGERRAYLARYRAGRLLEEETVDDRGQPVTRKHVDERVEVTRRFASGQLYRTYVTVKGDYEGDFKEWTQEGRLVEESRYAKGKPTARKRYYLNGKVKQELAVDPRSGIITVREFHDTGLPKQTGTYQPCRTDRCFEHPTPDGTVREYAEDGRLERETQYAAGELDGVRRVLHRNGKTAAEETYVQGRVRKLSCWSSSGQLELEEEYFEDGSRKSGAPTMSREERTQKGICRP
jgi:antitoxin component YwqK of YwqJK toxin-antitoxin module